MHLCAIDGYSIGGHVQVTALFLQLALLYYQVLRIVGEYSVEPATQASLQETWGKHKHLNGEAPIGLFHHSGCATLLVLCG